MEIIFCIHWLKRRGNFQCKWILKITKKSIPCLGKRPTGPVTLAGTHTPLRWRHNGCDSVSNHQPHYCLLNRLFRRRSKKTSKIRVTGLCVRIHRGPGNSPQKWPVTRRMFPFDDVIMPNHPAKKAWASDHVIIVTRCTPGNPFTHLGKIQRMPCDIYLEDVHFEGFNR